MSKFGVVVMGPAGAGKTTFCSALIQHLQNNRRSCFYINLDPAAEDFAFQPDVDIKDLISLDDECRLLVSHNKVPSELIRLFPQPGERVLLPVDPRLHPRPDYVARHRARFAGLDA